MIDSNRVAELRRDIDDADFDEIVQLFLSEAEELLQRLEDPASDTAAHLHALKGCALNLGFSAFAELCASYETGGPARMDFSGLSGCYEKSRAEFLRMIARG